MKPSGSPWSPLQSPCGSPWGEALLKPPSRSWRCGSQGGEVHLEDFEFRSCPSGRQGGGDLQKPFSSPLEAPFKPPSKPSPSSPLQALLKPPWSPSKAASQAPLEAPLEAPLKPFSSPLEAPFKPLKASQRWSPLQAPFKPPWEGLEAPPWSPPSSPPSSLLKVKGTVRFSLRILPGAPGDSARADIRVITLPIYAAWSMAPGKNHYRHGKT